MTNDLHCELTGTDGEFLRIRFLDSSDMGDLWICTLEIIISSDSETPRLNTSIFTEIYQIPIVDKLIQLVKGDQTAIFELNAPNFSMVVKEISLDPHYGFLVELCATSVPLETQWPDSVNLAKCLLTIMPRAKLIRIAFLCHQESLSAFLRQLEMILRSLERERLGHCP